MQQISDSEVPPLRLPPAFHLFVNRTASPPPQHRTADRPPGLGLRAAADLPPAAGALRPPGRRTSPRRTVVRGTVVRGFRRHRWRGRSTRREVLRSGSHQLGEPGGCCSAEEW